MPNAQDAFWFKSQFQPAIEKAIAGTPFSVDMITAFACQETGEIWPALRRKGLPTSRILELCVGDTIDASPTGGGRRAFPKNKAELLQAPQGDRMFAIARQGLVDMASHIPAYRGAASRPDKFCHGFGIFQLDLQFFKTEPDYFLSQRYADFDAALAKCVGELKSALRRIGWQGKTSLSDEEMAAVAIAYNTGRYNPAKGLKQGYFDGVKYYGENYYAYLQLARGARFPAAEAGPSRGARASPARAKAKAKGGKVAKAMSTKGGKTPKATGGTIAARADARTADVAKPGKAVKTTKRPKAAKAAKAAKAPKAAKRARTAKAVAAPRAAKATQTTRPAKTPRAAKKTPAAAAAAPRPKTKPATSARARRAPAKKAAATRR